MKILIHAAVLAFVLVVADVFVFMVLFFDTSKNCVIRALFQDKFGTTFFDKCTRNGNFSKS